MTRWISKVPFLGLLGTLEKDNFLEVRTVGITKCSKHGLRMGPLSCDHVQQAVYRTGKAVTFDRFYSDVIGDGESLLKFTLCKTCEVNFNLSPDQVIPEEVFVNEDALPYVGPTCGDCFKEWVSKWEKGADLGPMPISSKSGK